MQTQLDSLATELDIELFAINQVGLESGLEGMSVYGALPILQDDPDLLIWEMEGIEYRDVLILDADNQWLTTFNLTDNDLNDDSNYTALMDLLVGYAGGWPEPNTGWGQVDYEAYCGMCHGGVGEGYLSDNANALMTPSFLTTATDSFLRAAIEHGRPGTAMSGFGSELQGPLDFGAVYDLIGYIRTWQLGEPALDVHDLVVEGDADNGALLFGKYCASCHGDDGQGGEFSSVANPWLLATASDGFLRHAIAEGRVPTEMLPYAGTLTDAEIDDLVVHLRSLEETIHDTGVEYVFTDLSTAVLNEGGGEPSLTLIDDLYAPAAEVAAALDAGAEMVVLDVRTPSDYLLGHVTGSVSVPFYEIGNAAPELSQDVWIVLYCGCPHTLSGQAAAELQALGFTKIAVLDEGYFGWVDAAHPITVGAEPGELP